MVLQNFRWSVLAGGLFLAAAIAIAAVSPVIAPVRTVGAELPQQVQLSDRLYFGRLYPTGMVSESDWAIFLADVVTPRFPQGLTVWAANGQWRDGASRVNREPTFVLEVVHPAAADADAALKAIVAEYKRRFAQESVLWVRDRVNVVD